MKDKNYKNNLILHPSFDIKDDILLLGFQDKKYDERENKTKSYNIFLFAHGEEGNPIIRKNSDIGYINHEDNTYILEAKTDNKERCLVNINSKWSRDLMESLIDNISYINPSAIYNILHSELKAYLELEKEEDYHIITSWIIGSYFFILFKAYPYLHIKGMKGSGKTTALDFMRLTCFNAFKERSTMPSFRDNVDSQRGTALIDQADVRFGSKSEDDMLDVMVDSYKSSSGIMSKMVLVKGKQVRTEYNAYVPKAFASTKELNFDLKDRCIQIQFLKSLSNKNQIDSDNEKWLGMRHALYSILILNYKKIKSTIDEVESKYSTDTEIVGRNAELWKPIESIMKFCLRTEEEIETVRKVYKSKVIFVQDGISSLEAKMIEYIDIHLKGKESDWISVRTISDNMILDGDDEWEEKTFRSRTLLIGNLISRMNLHSSKKHMSGGNYYLFEKEKINKIKKAYLSEIDTDISPVFTPIINPEI